MNIEQRSISEALDRLTEPLRLAVGSHQRGSGKGCAMNVISWENGDKIITDLPTCSDRMLAKIVQQVNDNICAHRNGDLLCADCSVKVLDLGHRTVGTGQLPLTNQERKQVWVKVAADQARQVLGLVPAKGKGLAVRAIEAAESWAEDPSEINRQNAHTAHTAAAAAFAAAAAAFAATAAAHTAAFAATTAAFAATTDAGAAGSAAAFAAFAADAAAGAAGAEARLTLAHRAIDLFEHLTGHIQVPVSDEKVYEAYACMVGASA